MAKTPEGRVKDGVKALLESFEGCYYYMPVPGGFGAATLDFIGCFRGVFFAIETKANGGKPTKRQEQVIYRMRSCGAQVFVIAEEGSFALLPLVSFLEQVSQRIPHDPHLAPAPRRHRAV
jgi:hypothetical protein